MQQDFGQPGTAQTLFDEQGSLVPELAECVDDMAFVHSMVSKSNVHGPATFMQNTGFVLPGFPSMGAWVSYGLGSMTERQWKLFYDTMASEGLYPKGLDFRRAYDLSFVRATLQKYQ